MQYRYAYLSIPYKDMLLNASFHLFFQHFAVMTSIYPFMTEAAQSIAHTLREIRRMPYGTARTAAADVLRAGGGDSMVKAGVAFTRSLAHSGISAWEGIGDAEGKPVEPNKENIDAALEIWSLFDAIDRLYVGPALIQDAEKNA